MSLRTLPLVFGVATALSAQLAAALGLGEIKLNSTLNQPLDAEIELLQVRDLSEPEILIGLASMEDFRRVGVERPFFLSDLEFEVDLDSPEGPVIHVTSDKPVREPFLNFLVQAQWPSGRLLREYTLLMDLPVYSEGQQAQPVQAPQQQQQQRQQQPRTSAAPSTRTQRNVQPQQPEQAPRSGGAGSTYGPVKSDDTLWNIAAAARPDDSVSVQQSMIAIQRANPDAFINGNINLLREGHVLRLPSREEMARLTARQAIAEVASQNRQWTNRAQTAGGRPQLEGSRTYSSPEQATGQPEGRVKLSSPQQVSDSTEGRGTGSGDGSTDALETELNATLEELDRVRGENQELKSRLESLEEQIATMERLVDVSSEEMRALQLAAQQAQDQGDTAADGQQDTPEGDPAAADGAATGDTEAEDAPAADAEQGQPLAAGDEASGEEAEVDPMTLEQPAEEQAATTTDEPARAATVEAEPQETAPARDPTRVVRSAPEPEKTFVDHLIDNIIFIALGLVALLGGLLLLVRNRTNKRQEEEFEEFLVAEDEQDWQADEGFTAASDDSFDSLDLDDDSEQPLAAETEDQPEERAEQETEDAVAEAEIYMALAKYDQAEDILLRALEKEPGDRDIRLKLLELYAAQQDVDNFDPHYAKLRVLGDEDANARAEELRAKMGSVPAFDESRFDTSEFVGLVGAAAATGVATTAAARDDQDLDDDDLSFDLDFDASGGEPDPEAARLDEEINATLNDSGDDDFNGFDLDLDADEGLERPSAPETAAPAAVTEDDVASDDDLDLDFELNIEGGTGGEADSVGEFSLDDEFAFDLGSADAGDADASEVSEEAGQAEDLDDVDAVEFDLESAFEDVASDADAAEDENLLEWDLGDETRADLASSHDSADRAAEQELGQGDYTLDDVDSAQDATSSTLEEPVTLEDTVEENRETSTTVGSGEDNEDDDLNLEGDLDLAALDQELDAITSGLDSDTQASASDVWTENDSMAEDATLPMDEPLTDLDDWDTEEPSAETKEPSAEMNEPAAEMNEPAAEVEEPSEGTSEPSAETEEPATETAEPLAQAEQPSVQDEEPSAQSEEPSARDEEPSARDEEPSAWNEELAGQDEEPSARNEESSAEHEDPLTADEAAPAEPSSGLAEPEASEEPAAVEPPAAETEAEDVDALPDYDELLKSAGDINFDELDADDEDADFAFLSDTDETATKLDLARAYLDMGDADGAKDILDEILEEGSDEQRQEAQKLLDRV